MMKLEQLFLGESSRSKWVRIGLKRRCGVLAPLFSLSSSNSIGIGDFQDLMLFVDWADKVGFSIIQLLPMNITGPTHCPYDSESSFALEPVYISLSGLIKEYGLDSLQERIKELRKQFSFPREYVDYRIKEEKLKLLREIFLTQFKEDCPEFQRFRQENSYWLQDFALYKTLKYHFLGKPWYDWPQEFKYRHKATLTEFVEKNEVVILFHMWLQWQLYLQFKKVKEYAQKKNILLKGDLPILVSRDSADVWAHPEYFKLDYAAGAPPDMYCAQGQRWGMPTNNWERIAFDDYRYVKEKLKFAQNFYDILRIDHVVGLFRIWSIPIEEPLENAGLNGFFDPQDERLWREQGKSILSVYLSSTDMLLCAEDLGIIPKECPQVLQELGIPGNDVQRWMKDWQGTRDFLSPSEYRFLSVAMLSTHDTTNWAAWWDYEAGTVDEVLFTRMCQNRVDYERIKPFLFDCNLSRHGRLRWKKEVDSLDKLLVILGRKKEEVNDFVELYLNSFAEKEKLWQKFGLKGPLREKCDSQIIKKALEIVLDSESIFSIQLITDWLMLGGCLANDSYFYRINYPGTVKETNWSLVMPIMLEDLLLHPVNAKIKRMIVDSNRNNRR